MDTLTKSLELLDKLLTETPEEELQRLFKKIDAMDFCGPTVPQYFDDLQYILAKYQDSIGHPVDTMPVEFLDMFDFDYGLGSLEEVLPTFDASEIEYTAGECNYSMAA